jgi:hypothetical protein
MSIYFALEYDENGVSKIVQKKDTSTRAINQRDFKFGPYKGSPITSPEDPDEGNNTGDFIDQMGTGTMGGGNETDSFQRFIDRSGLNINQDKGTKDTTFINLLFKGLGIPVTAEGISEFMDNISKYLPETSPEIRRIRKFYSTSGPEGGLDFMNPSSPNYIPGMENYNIISGGLFGEPNVGLQDTLDRKSKNIVKTLKDKYGFTDIEIDQVKMGTYNGLKGFNKIMGKQTNLIDDLFNVSTLNYRERNYEDDYGNQDVVDPGMATETISTGAETVIDPNVDEEEGRPDDPSGPPSTGFRAPTKPGQSPRGTTTGSSDRGKDHDGGASAKAQSDDAAGMGGY